MASDVEYAKMIEIPHNTCEYSYKRRRTLFKKKKIVNNVNKQLEKELENQPSGVESLNESEMEANNLPTVYDEKIGKSEKRKNAVISVQVALIFALISAIILTNVFWENSGMNTLFRSVFQSDSVIEDTRSYNDFSLTMPASGEGVTLENGAISISGEYSLYPVCEGKVSKVEQATDGTYTVTVEHSESFSSVTEGLDLVYFGVGEQISKHMPLGFVASNAKVYLYNGESLITDYATVENSIIFNK